MTSRVTGGMGDIADVIYDTVFLTAPAQLEINSGGNLSTNTLACRDSILANAVHALYPETFTLQTEWDTTILSLQGPPIMSQITNYDFFPASGFVYGLTPPSNLHTAFQIKSPESGDLTSTALR